MSASGWPKTRMARASVLGLLVFAMLLAGAGFALAASADAAVPDRFEMAPWHDGDRGRYNVSLSGGWLYGASGPGEAFPFMSFEHVGHDQAHDAEGRPVEADVVRVEGRAYSRLPEGSGSPPWFDYRVELWSAADGSTIASRSGGTDTSTMDEGDIVETRIRQSTTTLRWEYPVEAQRDCLLAPPFAPHLDTTAPGRLQDGCDILGMHAGLPAGTPVEVVGLRTVDGVRVLTLRAASEDVRVSWHLVPGLPVPIALDVVAPSLWHDEPRRAHLLLDAFERGEATPHPLSISGEASEITPAPLHIWGPDDRGLDHPFPLHEAFARAVNDPDWDDLQQWRHAHPDGYVFKTGYEQMETDDGPSYAWRIHLSDGQAGFSFRATAEPASPAMALLGDELAVTFDTYPEPDAQADAAPMAGRLPDHLPTVASLWARWEHYAPPGVREGGADVYTFSILADGDGAPVIHMAVGRASRAEWGAQGLSVAGEEITETGWSDFSSLLLVTGDGRALWYEERDQTTEERASLLDPPAPPGETDRDTLATAQAAPRADGLWEIPGAAQGAGLGLAALAVALLYWAWPFVKGLPGLAMFSRIHGEELLEHRTRARIMDAVRAEPGIHFRGLAARLGVNPGQVRHHVRKLVDGRHLVESRGTGYTCYYPYKGTSRNLVHAGPVIRAASAQHILAALRGQPGASGKDLAAAAGLSPATTNYHLKRLQEAGLVTAKRDGRSLAVHLTPSGTQAVETILA